jgi:flagellin
MALGLVNNVAALNAQSNLTRTNNALTKSLERLSSGLKVNRGADGPAALVISEQQRAQIAGLRTAIDNTNKATSLAQTAEGALNEVNALLTKIRSLALDSANTGVNDANALAANQAEIKNALATITNIANTTKFGTKYLLNGDGGVTASIVGLNNSNLGQLRAGIGATEGLYTVRVGGASGGTITSSANAADDAAAAGIVTISGGGLAGSGVSVDVSSISTVAAAVTAIQAALDVKAGAGAFTVTGSNGSPIVITSNISATAITLAGDTAHARTLVGLGSGSETGTAGAALSNANVTNGIATGGRAASNAVMGGGTLASAGTLTISGGGLTQNLVVALAAGDNASDVVEKVQAALNNAGAIGGGAGRFIVTGSAGNNLVIQSNVLGSSAITIQANSAATTALTGVSNASADTGASGNALAVFVTDPNATVSQANVSTTGFRNVVTSGGSTGLSFNVGVSSGRATSGINTLNVVDNSLTFQIGANAGETVQLSIAKVTADALGTGVNGLLTSATNLNEIDVTTAEGAQDAIRIIDQAISDVSNIRGDLGAFQANTLETNANNLRATLENTVSAESVIRDTDFAAEIAIFTRNQTLLQAGATVLGNANQIPQLIASLLRS